MTLFLVGGLLAFFVPPSPIHAPNTSPARHAPWLAAPPSQRCGAPAMAEAAGEWVCAECGYIVTSTEAALPDSCPACWAAKPWEQGAAGFDPNGPLGDRRVRARRAPPTLSPPRSPADPPPPTPRAVHGSGGAYVGGHWVPLDECADKFNIKDGSDTRVDLSTPCPRSRTRHSAAKPDGSYDVAIIGSGCIGSAVARELSKTSASVIMLEAADDVCQGATKGNSGIVHAGYDDKPGSTRARLC